MEQESSSPRKGPKRGKRIAQYQEGLRKRIPCSALLQATAVASEVGAEQEESGLRREAEQQSKRRGAIYREEGDKGPCVCEKVKGSAEVRDVRNMRSKQTGRATQEEL